jgi:hypothetical protein
MKIFIRFIIFLFVILGISIWVTLNYFPEYSWDFLVSFIINLLNGIMGYIVSKKYFNASNSMFYTMIYGTMFIRFMFMLSAMLILILNGFVNQTPFFLSFVCFYISFQAFEIKSFLLLNEQSRK